LGITESKQLEKATNALFNWWWLILLMISSSLLIWWFAFKKR
jgi:hypothetical protein